MIFGDGERGDVSPPGDSLFSARFLMWDLGADVLGLPPRYDVIDYEFQSPRGLTSPRSPDHLK